MGDEIPKIEDNVMKFLNKCSKEVGKAADDIFNYSTFSEFIDLGIKSPIEQILYAALKTVRALNDIQEDDPITVGDKEWPYGLGFYPQREIGKYRVDFIVSYFWYPKKGTQGYFQKEKEVIVECDSQAFHERTEPERRHEKARDRFLQSQGHKIFRFTGTEIVREPLRVAKEIISYVTGIDATDLQEDSNWE